jgi:uncharacterized repeat protein (TIGR01451 family)
VTTYKFLALKPVETSLCSYTAIRFEADKYDNQYCDPQSTINITGSLSFSLTKTASRSIVLQDDYLTYTIEYTNNGTVDLQSAWIWDEIDPALATFVAHTNNPAPDPAASSDSRIAWFLDNVPAGSSGTLTITAQIEGDGKDLTNGTSIVNNAYFGINPGSLPSVKAMTSTVTSTLEAPDINIEKSDGLSIIGSGESLTYTINLMNDGSVPATGLVLTDVLPAGVSLVGNPFPAPDEVSNGVIKWYSSTLGTLEPNGGSLTITIPVSVTTNVSDGTTLTNSATLLFENDIGHLYQPSTDEDTTTVIKKKGFVEGIAYEDLDGDGILDGAEPGIPGVKVLLPAAISPMVTTDSNGYYRFQIYSEGPVSTTANLPSGYFQTTPGLVFFQNTFGVTKTVNFGFAKDSSDFGVVYGTVFEDGDQNGVQELGEDGLSGVNITSADAATTTVLSNEFGQYTLLFNAGISTTISATNPLGYVSTNTDIVALDVITGSDNSTPVDFGEFQGIKITGMVFEDSNVNGENDGESGLAGALVQANGKSMTTGSSGVYTLYLSTDGRPITVTEADPSGYVSTNAVPGSGMAKIDNNSLQISNPVSGTVYTGDFGDVNEAVVATIYGYVFEDANGNGIKDSGEPGIPGVDVWLDQTITDTTNADGLYSFATAVSATHTVTEEQPSGYFSTTPDEVHLAVKLGQNYRVDFGDASDKAGFSAIYGTVFEDSNSDGLWDDTEIGLTNVTVTLSITKSLVTDLYGRYTFSTTITGDQTIVETDPEYYFSTTPNTVTVDVELNNGYQVNYGDVRADMARCPADAFEEDDANNQAKDLSVGVVQKHDFCDDAVDWTKISVKTGRTYTITTSSWGQRADTHLALFDMDGQTLLIANDDYAGSVDHSSRLIWKATDTGEFFIRTTNRAALEGFHTEYNIWVDEEKVHFVYLPLLIKPPSPTSGLGQGAMFSMASIEANFFFPNSPDGPSGEINHACPDAYEIDDTWQQAKDIEVGIPQLHWFDSDSVIYAADKDFGAFDLQSGQEITFTVTSTTSTEVLLELYDDQGIYAGLWGIDSLKVNGLQAGKYFLSASPTSSVFKSCENKPSYELLAETKAQSSVYIPIIIK